MNYQPREIRPKALTRTERCAVYKRVLERIEGDWKREQIPGLCYALEQIGHFAYGDDNMRRKFPELWKQRPRSTISGDRWWPMCEWTKRKAALRKAIELSEKKLP
jgi:hypothetical protein